MENQTPPTPSTSTLEQIKIIELVHIIGNLISGGALGMLGVIAYMFINKELSPEAKAICYDVINFNLSFIIYTIIAFISLIVLIGFILLPIVYIVWLVLMILGAVKHLAGERYEYPLVIKFIQ